jgi:SAM-dependent methyltransferase
MPIKQDAYDTVAYPGFAYPDTHPDRMAVMGMLHGLDPAPVEHCRVLEIGCNEAANLIPMAYAIPGGEFIGFDIAGQPIARGQQRIRELGLSNIKLFQANLMDVGEPLGKFDYVIAHGVYAWVPEPVRDGLLALCREHLTPNGIAFISYNALPGGHLRNMVREILLQRAKGISDPAESVSESLQFLRFIMESRPQGDPFRALLEREAKQLEQRDAQVVYHDELSSEHRPVSFTSFVSHATAHGLKYLSESVLPTPTDPCFQPDVAKTAEAIANGDPIVQEQILDFARMRMYRETLLCHADRKVSSEVCLETLDRMRVASQAKSSPGEGSVLRVFTLPGGIRMESQHAGTVVLMECLIEAWPQSVPFTQLKELLASKGIVLDQEFPTVMLRLAVARMVEFHTWAAPVSRRITSQPKASATSRQEAALHAHATTLLHSSLRLGDPLVRQFLLLLDGTRDRAELLRALRNKYPDIPEATLAEGIEPNLSLLHYSGVLLAEGFG